MDALVESLRRRLWETLPGREAQLRMAPQPRTWPPPGTSLKPAAALVLLYPRQHQWWVPLTVRGAAMRHHGGQVSLPGGRVDHPDESVEQAALREAQEEIGVVASEVDVLGRLTPLPIAVSGHLLCPVVGVIRQRPSFTIAPAEVERLIEVPVSRLTAPDVVAWEQRVRWQLPQETMNVPYFAIDGARVWGATAMILAEFIAVLERLDR